MYGHHFSNTSLQAEINPPRGEGSIHFKKKKQREREESGKKGKRRQRGEGKEEKEKREGGKEGEKKEKEGLKKKKKNKGIRMAKPWPKKKVGSSSLSLRTIMDR